MHKKSGSVVRYCHRTEADERAWSAQCHLNAMKGSSQLGYFLASPRSHPQTSEAAGFPQKLHMGNDSLKQAHSVPNLQT